MPCGVGDSPEGGGATKGKQTTTMASCQTSPPFCGSWRVYQKKTMVDDLPDPKMLMVCKMS